MLESEMLYVFCYDIQRDRTRERVADIMEERLARVQLSVFEGRMNARQAKQLGEKAARLLGPDDSLRIYAISAVGLKRSLAYGPKPLAEAQDFYLA